jgi:checkpoint serine/threonine-protein kinase
LTEADDPLAAYHQFVQWTIKNYGESNPKSGLKDLLMEATLQFKDDPLYKADLRYLKLWALYARQVDKADALAIYASLVANDIGTSYSALYEDYANLLEGGGRYVTTSSRVRVMKELFVDETMQMQSIVKEFRSQLDP